MRKLICGSVIFTVGYLVGNNQSLSNTINKYRTKTQLVRQLSQDETFLTMTKSYLWLKSKSDKELERKISHVEWYSKQDE